MLQLDNDNTFYRKPMDSIAIEAEKDEMPYLLLKPMTGMIASPDRVFIYVLMLNVEGVSSKPFYVGYTNNLEKRLMKHSAILWHHKKFKTPPKVWVIGTVHAKNSAAAARSLKLSLLNSGHVFYVRAQEKIREEHVDGWENILWNHQKLTTSISEYSEASLKTYFAQKLEAESLVMPWFEQWRVKTTAKTKSERKESEENQEDVDEKMGAAIDNPISSKVKSFILKRRYASNAALTTARKLANSYNYETGYAVVRFRGSSDSQKNAMRLTDAKRTIHEISADWKLETTLSTQSIMRFTLTLTARKAISKIR
jgi:predicted GIY-YIG superfamily endonuclease